MKKEHLRDGMIVEIDWQLMGARKYLVCGDKLIGLAGIVNLKNISDDLKCIGVNSVVSRVFYISENIKNIDGIYNDENLNLIWEREDKTDWSKIEKYTKVQVRWSVDGKWENGYFIKEEQGKFFTVSLKRDDFTNDEGPMMIWAKCRLYKEEK